MEETETQKKAFNPTLLIVVIVLLLVGGFLWFSNNQSQNQPADQQPAETTVEAPTDAAMTDESAKTFTVEGKPFSFTPDEIRVKKGDRVKITFTNAAGLHDYTIDELNVKTKQLAVGESETVEFTADQVGTFEFYCGVGNHRQQGMVGNLIVEE
jgi:cytochrome c oxidase subunit 2